MRIQHRINSQQNSQKQAGMLIWGWGFGFLPLIKTYKGSSVGQLCASLHGRLCKQAQTAGYHQADRRRTVVTAAPRRTIRGPKKHYQKKLSKERLGASLRVQFFFLFLGKLRKPSDEKLPLHDGDGDVGKKDEPGDRVHPPVEHVCHGDTNAQMSRWLRSSGRSVGCGCEVSGICQESKAVTVVQ